MAVSARHLQLQACGSAPPAVLRLLCWHFGTCMMSNVSLPCAASQAFATKTLPPATAPPTQPLAASPRPSTRRRVCTARECTGQAAAHAHAALHPALSAVPPCIMCACGPHRTSRHTQCALQSALQAALRCELGATWAQYASPTSCQMARPLGGAGWTPRTCLAPMGGACQRTLRSTAIAAFQASVLCCAG